VLVLVLVLLLVLVPILVRGLLLGGAWDVGA
jgi:hypothetical protein